MKNELLFITSNENKLREAQEILDQYRVIGNDIAIEEIQSLDRALVVQHKIACAYDAVGRPCFVEDVSVVFEALGSLPGPLIKFFLDSLGSQGVAELVHKYDNHRAHVTCMIGYADDRGHFSFHEGHISGKIVLPCGSGGSGFGFDPIFIADGQEVTFAQLPLAVKNTISQRFLALQELKTFLLRDER